MKDCSTAVRPNILLVDDREENLFALEELLRGEEVEFHRAQSGTQALELLLQNDYAVALLDVQMPQMDGFELAETMRSTEKTRGIPIIFVTAGVHSRDRIFKGYEAGAVDFLHKPLDPHIVRSKVRVFIQLHAQNSLLREQLEALHRHQGELKRTELRLRQALQARDNFLSIASHELKTPVTSMKLTAQLLMRNMERQDAGILEPEKVRRMIEQSDRQLSRLTRLVDDMLDISRISSGKLTIHLEEMDFAEVVRDLVERLQSQLEAAECSVNLNLEEGVIGSWDRYRIEQVITNLLTNAMRYGGGKPADIILKRAEGGIQLEIHDRGIGIAPENHKRIFDRFERAESSHEGSGLGLGLFIVRQIVELHGGSIHVKSALGEGAAFIVKLPLRTALEGGAAENLDR